MKDRRAGIVEMLIRPDGDIFFLDLDPKFPSVHAK